MLDLLIKRKTDLKLKPKAASSSQECQNISHHTMFIPVCLATFLMLLSIPSDVQAHGYLKSPRSRNWVARQQGIEYNAQSLNKKAGYETCGRSPQPRNYNTWSSNTFNEHTYAVGQQIDVEVTFTAHHKGHFVLKACPISSGGTATQACFDNNKLRFISGEGANFDPNYPERAYIPPPPPGTQDPNTGAGVNGYTWNYRYKFQLPPGLSGDRVLLQWHYVTANSCLPPGYDKYNFPPGWRPSAPVCGPIPTEVLTDGVIPEQVSTSIFSHLSGHNGHMPGCNNHILSC